MDFNNAITFETIATLRDFAAKNDIEHGSCGDRFYGDFRYTSSGFEVVIMEVAEVFHNKRIEYKASGRNSNPNMWNYASQHLLNSNSERACLRTTCDFYRLDIPDDPRYPRIKVDTTTNFSLLEAGDLVIREMYGDTEEAFEWLKNQPFYERIKSHKH